MERVDQLAREQMRADLPAFRPGDTVEVHVRIVEGDKERIQVFKGVVIRKRGGLTGASFTVRKVSYGVGVERIFPMHSPNIDQVVVLRFDDQLAALVPQAFIDDVLLTGLGARYVLVGDDFRFGVRRAARVQNVLTSLKVLIDMIPELEQKSNRIINSLRNGDAVEA